MYSALTGGFGMALPPRGPPDGSMFLGGRGSASPVGYGLDGDGFAQQPQQHFSAHAAFQPQGYGGGGHHVHAQQGSVGQVRYPHNHGQESFPAGSPQGGGGDQAVISWAPGGVERGHHGGGGGGSGVSQQMMEAAVAAAERSAENRQHHLLIQRETSPSVPGASCEPSRTDNNERAGGGGGVPSSSGAMHAPVPMLRELRRQSSLPHLSEDRPTLMPARMAQTPPLTFSSRRGFLGGGEEDVPQVSDDSAVAAAAAAGGGATEAWERERSRFSVRGRRSPPTESRIAAVAFTTRSAATAEQSKNASSATGGTGGGDAASPAPTATVSAVNTKSVEGSGSVPAESESMGSARYSSEPGELRGDVRGGGSDGGGGLVTAEEGDLSLGERSLEVGDDRAALPGLNDFVSSGHRYVGLVCKVVPSRVMISAMCVM